MKGTNLRKARLAKGYSRFELAKKAGVSPNTIQALESDIISNPTIQTCTRLANALEVPVEELFAEFTESLQ